METGDLVRLAVMSFYVSAVLVAMVMQAEVLHNYGRRNPMLRTDRPWLLAGVCVAPIAYAVVSVVVWWLLRDKLGEFDAAIRIVTRAYVVIGAVTMRWMFTYAPSWRDMVYREVLPRLVRPD